MSDKVFFITTPIYYINATPHIGHAYTQIAADARARFERSRGRRVYFLTGTDENALKVSRVARELGQSPQDYADEMAQAFRDVWDQLHISYDDYIRTTEPRHRVVVQRVVERLWQEDHLSLGTYSGWYSVPDETFFRDEETVERDGQHFLANPSIDQTKDALEWVEETAHYFKLSQFENSLLKYFEAHPEAMRPEVRRNETLSFIGMGLRDTSISRVQDWGIPMPATIPDHENHVVYVWFPDALLNYASAPGYLSDDPDRRVFFDEVWPPDVHLMSKDIFTRFHTTLWPALLQALDLPLPRECFAHGFWTVDGKKMGKRDPATIVEPIAFAHHIAELAGCDQDIAVDALRYYCLREVTFGNDGDFSRFGCLSRYNTDLANGLGNLVNRTLSMLQQYFGHVVPSTDGDLGLRRSTESLLPELERYYATLDFSSALSTVWDVVAHANRLIEEEKPWAKVKRGEIQEVEVLMRELLSACQWCAITLAPVMPIVGARLLQLLNLESEAKWGDALKWSLISPGHRCEAPQALFPRIQNLQKQKEKFMPDSLNLTQEPSSTPKTASTDLMPVVCETASPDQQPNKTENYITYEDFAKIQLRTGKIIEAERIPKADKLLRLQIDIGSETRQILAGIAQQFEPESIVGRTVVVVTNLAARKLRGFESQGMLLAVSGAEDGAPIALATADSEVMPGSIVR